MPNLDPPLNFIPSPKTSMTGGPVARSGPRRRACIKYPGPLIDRQTLCVWKPPGGPGVNSRTDNTGGWFRILDRGKKDIQFLLKHVFCNVLVPHIESLLRSPSTGNEKEVIQGWSDVSGGISSLLHGVRRYSVERRSTGFDLRGPCQTRGHVWNQTDSPREIPAPAQTTVKLCIQLYCLFK